MSYLDKHKWSIWAMHHYGMNATSIATRLYDDGVRSPYGPQNWYDDGQIRNMAAGVRQLLNDTQTERENHERKLARQSERGCEAWRLKQERCRKERWDKVTNGQTGMEHSRWYRGMRALALKRSGMTYREIGECLGVCSSRANQIVEWARRTSERRGGRGPSPVERYLTAPLEIDRATARRMIATLEALCPRAGDTTNRRAQSQIQPENGLDCISESLVRYFAKSDVTLG